MTPSDWAAWVQAVGSIAAIIGSFRIARRQHEHERAADRERRRDEMQGALDEQLRARTLAVRNVVQVATHALDTVRLGVAHVRASQGRWEADAFLLKADQLRQVLDSLITPATEHLAVVSALQISQIVVLTHADMKNTGGAMTQQLVSRSDDRIVEGYRTLENLIQLQARLVAMCRSRGIPLEIEDFSTSG